MVLHTFLIQSAAEGTENHHCPGPTLPCCHLSPFPSSLASSLQTPACGSASPSPQTRDHSALVWWDTAVLLSYFLSTREGRDLPVCSQPMACLLEVHFFSLNPAWPILDAFPLLAALLLALSLEPCVQGSSLTPLSFTVTGLPQCAAIQCPQCFCCFIHNVTTTPRTAIRAINILIKALVISHLCL